MLSGRLDVRGSIATWPVSFFVFYFSGTGRVRVGSKAAEGAGLASTISEFLNQIPTDTLVDVLATG
jgi:hypothetical protein